jgi:hypothetical protein
MKVSEPPKHTNCITRLLRFDLKLDATLLLLKLASEESVARNLGGITKI